jgi:serine/threonine protein phosphatase PrpC
MCFTTKKRITQFRNSRKVFNTLTETNKNNITNNVKISRESCLFNRRTDNKYLSPDPNGNTLININKKYQLGFNHNNTTNTITNNDRYHLKSFKSKVGLPPININQINSYKSHSKLFPVTQEDSIVNIKPYLSTTNTKENISTNTNISNKSFLHSNINVYATLNNNNTSHQKQNIFYHKITPFINKIPINNKKPKRFAPFNYIISLPSAITSSSPCNIFFSKSNSNQTSNNILNKQTSSPFLYQKQQIQKTDNSIINSNKSIECPSAHKDNSFLIKPLSSLIRHSELSQHGKNEQGKVKINQDTYLMLTSICNLDDVMIYGVLDGHGPNGHCASKSAKDIIIQYFSNKEIYSSNKNQACTINSDIIYNKLSKNNYEFIYSFVSYLHKTISSKTNVDVNFSGTTLNLLFHIGDKIINCNVGDSRSIVITYHKNNFHPFQVEQFGIDHKPTYTSEYERIIANGGEVKTCNNDNNENGIKRIWVKNERYPGIAISRTIGDLVAHKVGVIETPDINEKDIIEDNICAVVCATDGVWEYLSNEEIMDIVMKYYYKGDTKNAVNDVFKEASLRWKKEGPVMDDITCIVTFYNLENMKK